jgi:hypothetical protein
MLLSVRAGDARGGSSIVRGGLHPRAPTTSVASRCDTSTAGASPCILLIGEPRVEGDPAPTKVLPDLDRLGSVARQSPAVERGHGDGESLADLLGREQVVDAVLRRDWMLRVATHIYYTSAATTENDNAREENPRHPGGRSGSDLRDDGGPARHWTSWRRQGQASLRSATLRAALDCPWTPTATSGGAVGSGRAVSGGGRAGDGEGRRGCEGGWGGEGGGCGEGGRAREGRRRWGGARWVAEGAGEGGDTLCTAVRDGVSSRTVIGMSSPDGDETEPRRGPGRPRKWANDAERVRAYRARKSEEQASVDQLRRDRRTLRRQVVDLTARLARAERAAAEANQRADLLAADLDENGKKLRGSELDVEWFRGQLTAAREHPAEAPVRGRHEAIDAPLAESTQASPALSRAQRGAVERRRRRH